MSLAYHIVRDHSFQENEKHDQEFPLAFVHPFAVLSCGCSMYICRKHLFPFEWLEWIWMPTSPLLKRERYIFFSVYKCTYRVLQCSSIPLIDLIINSYWHIFTTVLHLNTWRNCILTIASVSYQCEFSKLYLISCGIRVGYHIRESVATVPVSLIMLIIEALF